LYAPDASTEDLYEDLVAPLLPLAWSGGVGTLFAYGQTGSGKTFTVSAIEKIVGEELWSGTFDGERTIVMTIVEVAGNSGFGIVSPFLASGTTPYSI
jgi:kinesin family protein 2/24